MTCGLLQSGDNRNPPGSPQLSASSVGCGSGAPRLSSILDPPKYDGGLVERALLSLGWGHGLEIETRTVAPWGSLSFAGHSTAPEDRWLLLKGFVLLSSFSGLKGLGQHSGAQSGKHS